MNNITSPACLPKCYSYAIMGNLEVEIVVDQNVYGIPIDALFLMAARNNSKRGFLFVSKVLGKHIPTHPLIPLLGGAALAARYASVIDSEKRFEENCNFAEAFTNDAAMKKAWEYVSRHPLSLPEQTLFIGFAETATALGHAMFSFFGENARYIHTTRENIVDIDNILSFVEEHSHATEHYCYAMDTGLFENEHRVVLIDDEITTGKSALNFIRAIQSQYPRKEYAVVSLLDWRSAAEQQRFIDVEEELGIRIHCISLVSGAITVSGQTVVDDETLDTSVVQEQRQPIIEQMILDHDLGRLLALSSCSLLGELNFVPYLYSTGRFGIDSQSQSKLDEQFRQAGLFLQQKRQGTNTLCLGTGEFMYIPFRIASYMGEGVSVQSTTRSPIHPAGHANYGVQQAISFSSPDDSSIVNYVYNIPVGYYEEVFIFFERLVSNKALESLLEAFKQLNIPKIYCIICVPDTDYQ